MTKAKILFSAQHIFIYDMVTCKFGVVVTMGEEYKRHSPLTIATKGARTYLSDLKSICGHDSSEGTFRATCQGQYIINDAFMDQDGIFWLAFTEGLVRYDPQTGKSELINTSLFQDVVSVVVDNQY